MTLDELRSFLELADRQGVRGSTPLKVVINGQAGVYDITASNVGSSITQTPTLGIRRAPDS